MQKCQLRSAHTLQLKMIKTAQLSQKNDVRRRRNPFCRIHLGCTFIAQSQVSFLSKLVWKWWPFSQEYLDSSNKHASPHSPFPFLYIYLYQYCEFTRCWNVLTVHRSWKIALDSSQSLIPSIQNWPCKVISYHCFMGDD